MNKEINRWDLTIVQSRLYPGRYFDNVLLNFSKFHNNNIIQRVAGPVVNICVAGFAVLAILNNRIKNVSNPNTKLCSC